MGETEEKSYSSEMNEKITEAAHDMQRSLEFNSFYMSLLENPRGFPSYFLGIDGQLRRNDCALRLAYEIHNGLITYGKAIEELRKFSNDIIEKGWVQLELWNQSKLDQP